MKTKTLIAVIIGLFLSVNLIGQNAERYVTNKSHIKFFSTTPAEDIEANNYTTTGTINTSTGNVVFSVPMQGFEFEKALMQKHFNQSNFLDTKQFPTARLVGKITNIETIDFATPGTYDANIEGELTIKGVTNTIKERGQITVSAEGLRVYSVFNVTLADYGIEFVRGKPASNVAKTVEVTVQAEYLPQ
jgi:polyisoprenoid-binding protein YceI